MTVKTPQRIKAYKQAEGTRAGSERDAEIRRHLPLVHTVVERIAVNLPSHVDHDDLFHAGVLGLIDSIDRFDPTQGTAFSTYAVLRIRGAVIDELRARDWVPRGARGRAKEYQAAVHALQNRLGRIPEDTELAEELGVAVTELPDIERAATLASQVSLETPVDGESVLGDHLIHRSKEEDPSVGLQREDCAKVLRSALGSLSEQERLVIKLYYFEGLLLREIAQVLGRTESRICQIHSRIMAVLRAKLIESGVDP